MARVTIIGMGNRLRGDDAAGPLVVETLAGKDLPEGIAVAQAPEDPVRLIDMLADTDAAVFVDAADMEADPGTVKVFRRDEDWTAIQPLSSVHSVGIQQLLPMARRLGVTAPVVLVAVQAADWEFGREPTPAIMDHLEELGQTALKEACDALEGFDHR